MTATLNHKQHRSGQRRGGAAPVAASRAVHTSAALMDVQSGSRVRPVGGASRTFRRFARCLTSSQLDRAGRHLSGPLSHSCIASRCPLGGDGDRRADSLSRVRQSATYCSSAQARVGVQTVHDASLLNTIADQLPCKLSDPLKFHSSSLSSVCVPDASTAIGMAFANEQKDTAAGVKSD